MKHSKHFKTAAAAAMTAVLTLSAEITSPQGLRAPNAEGPLAPSNLVAWEVYSVVNGRVRGPEDVAQMLQRIGFKRNAYQQSPTDPSSPSKFSADEVIRAMHKHGIEVFAWYFTVNHDDPGADAGVRSSFEAFKRHNIRPQIWVSQSFNHPKTAEEWKKVFPDIVADVARLPEAEQDKWFAKRNQLDLELERFPKTLEEQKQRLDRESDRIYSLAKLAADYGLTVQLYNHKGWFGIMDNQLALIDRLKERGITNVGIVYTFWHARDVLHDDTKNFPQVWAKIRPHVSGVNISGVRKELETLYPSQGDHELEMLRTIKASGWRGPIGVLGAYHPHDTEAALKNILRGCDWLAAELEKPGSGGPRPFPYAAGTAPKSVRASPATN